MCAHLAETGDLIIAIEKGIITKDNIYSEIDELISGIKTGRENQDEIIYFKACRSARDACNRLM